MNEEQIKQLIVRVIDQLKKQEEFSLGQEKRNESQGYATPCLQNKQFTQDSSFQVEVSARHIHLSQEHMKALFGEQEVKIKKELSQPGQYQADIRVTLVGPKGVLQNIAVLGPTRKNTQIELSMTDARVLGINPPVRDSGDTKGSCGIIISANGKAVQLEEGVIIAKRHIHMTPQDAQLRKVKDKDIVRVRVDGERPLIFDDVLVRVSERYRLAMHIDFDEANACGYRSDTKGVIIFDDMSCGYSLVNNPDQKDIKQCSSVEKSPLKEGEQKIEKTIGKKLINESTLKEMAKDDFQILKISTHAIVTPLAMDWIRNKNIEIRRM